LGSRPFASKLITHVLHNPNVQYSVHMSMSPTGILNHTNPVHTIPVYFSGSILKCSSIYFQFLQVLAFLQVSSPKYCMYFSSSPYVPHA